MTRSEIINKKFPHAFFGYDVEDVDLFLDELIREMDRIHNELDMESLRVEAARQRESRFRERIELLTAALESAGIPVPEGFGAYDEADEAEEGYTDDTEHEAESAETQADGSGAEADSEGSETDAAQGEA